MQQIRPPAVAGMFYPSQPEELRAEVESFLEAAEPRATEGARVKALIAPHAGYVYSGAIAGSAFVQLAADAAEVRRIVLLGPAHRVPLWGLGLPGCTAFATPLGDVPVAADAVSSLQKLEQVCESAAAHAPEHSLEVEVPFLQVLLGEFELLPLVVGDASGEEVAGVLEQVWGGPETRIVVSSDLSHYLPYDAARTTDRETAESILRLETPLAAGRACGAVPINGLLTVARGKGLSPRLLDLRNSGDTAGDRAQVVGYGAFDFLEAA